MDDTPTRPTTHGRPLRLWPGVVLGVLLLLSMLVLPWVAPAAALYGLLAGVGCASAILAWWVFFSRAPWAERVGVIALVVVAVFALRLVVHQSIAGAGMGFLFPIYGVLSASVAIVLGALVGRRLATLKRRAALAPCVLIACGAWAFVRTGGITGDGDSDLSWRWSQTPEERLLARAGDGRGGGRERRPSDGEPLVIGDWPGFRGHGRDGVVRGAHVARISTDWQTSPPVELWRRPVGPGWSSFAVAGALIFTQEQRGEHEVVACYDAISGEPVWAHRDAARFYESNGGAGPRGTPTYSGGRVYALGATGILNVLEAHDGAVVWTRNAAADTGTKVPGWGFAASPLVVGDVVVVATAGTLAAYDIQTGEPRWFGPKGGGGYSSPHLLTIEGVTQVVLLCAAGAVSVAPEDGRVLWQYPLPRNARIVQPAVAEGGDLLLSEGEGSYLRRVAVARGEGGWKVEGRWESEGLKPYFNDFVVHEGHAYGLDAGALACIDLASGERRWEGGDYGSGQLVLLPEQDVLLVVSERGELAAVAAVPGGFDEHARLPAIKGKTWNHPVLAGDLLLVRNAEEMAAFRLPRQPR